MRRVLGRCPGAFIYLKHQKISRCLTMRRSAVRKDAKEESDDPDDNDDDDYSEDKESEDQYRFISDESFEYLKK